MNQVEPYELWVGNAGDGRAFKDLFALGIRAIVQTAVEEEPLRPSREFLYLRFPLVDGPGNDPATIEMTVASVVRLVRMEIPTLICCGAGMSRSPAIAAAALAILRQVPLDDSLKSVAQYRRMDISPGLWAEVIQRLSSIS